MSPAPQTVDGYLAALPEDQRVALKKLRETIKAAAPAAAESIRYGIPSFKYKRRPLIHIGAAKHHSAIYGLIPDAFKDELKQYDTSTGTIRFPADKPLPETLVRKLVKARIKEIEAGATGYRQKRDKEG